MVAKRLDDDEKGLSTTDTPGGSQSVTVVNETGLYRVIFLSRKPAAARFKRWVFHDVLPSIRRTGQYGGVSEERIIELAAAVVARMLPAAQKPTTWADVASDGIISVELIDSLRLPPATSRRRVAGRLGAILRDQLARLGIPGPVKRGGHLFYPRTEALRITAEHRDLLLETCRVQHDAAQGVLQFELRRP